MQSVLIKTVSLETGYPMEFAYECHNEATLMAIVKGTLEGCSGSNYAMTGMEVA